ncbi:MAG: tripartite tricarboxylate transporter substrate-binding protein, partial [Pseudomonadota bacterium]|nr:tripartite tricarboxylate transporter substrate-binding protein [Pseudomonadota bacterium]
WWALLAPAGTPPEIIAKLNAEAQQALRDPAVRERLQSLGAVVTPGTPQQLSAFLREDVHKWARVIKAAKIAVE